MEQLGMQIVAYVIFGSMMLSIIVFWPLLIGMVVKRLYDYLVDWQHEREQRSAVASSQTSPSA